MGLMNRFSAQSVLLRSLRLIRLEGTIQKLRNTCNVGEPPGRVGTRPWVINMILHHHTLYPQT